MMVVRPLLMVLILMLSGLYVDAFSREADHAKRHLNSVAQDVAGFLIDIRAQRSRKVRLSYNMPEGMQCMFCSELSTCLSVLAYSYLG